MDLHCEMILEEYQAALPDLERLLNDVLTRLREALERNEMMVTTVEGRHGNRWKVSWHSKGLSMLR